MNSTTTNEGPTKTTGYEVIYVDSLDRKEKQAYLIAKSHLGDSFSLKKSLGFLEWVKDRRSVEDRSIATEDRSIAREEQKT